MIYLDSLIKKKSIIRENQYPFNLSVINHFQKIRFDSPVTFFVGENGSGKSTLLETIAVGMRLTSINGQHQENDEQFTGARALAQHMTFVKKRYPKKGFFFRSEDFVSFIDRINASKQDLTEMHDHFDKELKGYGRLLVMGMAKNQASALDDRYGGNPPCWHRFYLK